MLLYQSIHNCKTPQTLALASENFYFQMKEPVSSPHTWETGGPVCPPSSPDAQAATGNRGTRRGVYSCLLTWLCLTVTKGLQARSGGGEPLPTEENCWVMSSPRHTEGNACDMGNNYQVPRRVRAPRAAARAPSPLAHRGQFQGNLPSVLFYYEMRWVVLETRCLCRPHSNVTILIPRGMVLGGGAWERRLGQEGRSIRVGLVPLLRDPTEPWPSFCPGRRQGDISGLQPGRGAMPAP